MSIRVLPDCTKIFFSLISGKRERYLLPAYPAFSVVLAHIIARWAERREKSISVRICGMMTLAATIAILAFPIAVPFLKANFPLLKIFPVTAQDWRIWTMYAIGLAALVMLTQGLKSAKTGFHLRAITLIALAFMVVSGIYQMYYIPCIDYVKSARHAVATIQAILPAEGKAVFYRRRYDNGWNFYLNRDKIPVLTDADINRRPVGYDLIILREKDLKSLKKAMVPDNYEIAAIEPIGSKHFVLLRKVSGGK